MSEAPVGVSEADEVGRWSDCTRAAARVLLVVLAGAVLLAVFGQRWAVWLGFGVAGVAVVGSFTSLNRLIGASTSDVRAAPRDARRRVARAIRRGERPAAQDESLAAASACMVLRNATSGVWNGLLLAGSQISGFFAAGGADVLRLGLLVGFVLLTLAGYWYSGRVRRNLHPQTPPGR